MKISSIKDNMALTSEALTYLLPMLPGAEPTKTASGTCERLQEWY